MCYQTGAGKPNVGRHPSYINGCSGMWWQKARQARKQQGKPTRQMRQAEGNARRVPNRRQARWEVVNVMLSLARV